MTVRWASCGATKVLVIALVLSIAAGSQTAHGQTTSMAMGEALVAASPEAAAEAGLTVVAEVGFGWTLVEAPASDIVGLAAHTGFEVEPNYVYQLADEPLFPDQWSLENTGQTGGKVDADIDLLDAWTWTTGAPDVTVAILDTGVGLAHSDLSPNLWANPGEVGGNGLDDDGNGYVDDVRGWDAIDNDANPSDTEGHGTFVATTAVAALNDVGMAGVAPSSTLMAIRVCDNNGCPLSAVLTGLAYAMANEADVANMSFGGSFGLSSGFEDAVQANVDAGVVVVAAAGNQSRDNDLIPFYPASFDIDGLIAVAASDHDDLMPSFSNYGAISVDLAAPGQDVVGGSLPNDFAVGSGTSFAAPHVTGVAALVKAMRPDLDPPDIADLILQSVDRFPTFSGRMVSGGRLNAGSALEQANAPVAVAVASPRTGTLPFTVQLNGSRSFDPVGSIVSRSWKLPDGSVVKSTNTSWSPRAPGLYKATLTVVDNDGLLDRSTVSMTAALRPGGTFTDDNDSIFEGAIEAIAAERITLGCNPPTNDHYCPDDLVTRGQMAIFLVRAFDYIDNGGGNQFVDDEGRVYEGAADRLKTAGVTQGCNPPTNDRYCGDDFVTRAQMAGFLVRALGLTEDGGGDLYVDDDNSIFELAIDRLGTAGITQGCNPPINDRFCPDENVTRGQMAAFLMRALGLTPILPPDPR
ncbi:MAG: S8 family serine peptidase [Acidimicrobiia bacterium]